METGDWSGAREDLKGVVETREIGPILHSDLAKLYHMATKGPARAFNMASDLARYSILLKYGGVYIDVDLGPGTVDLGQVPMMGLDDVPMLAPSVRDRRALKEQLTKEQLEQLDFASAVQLAATQAYLKNQLNNNLIIT